MGMAEGRGGGQAWFFFTPGTMAGWWFRGFYGSCKVLGHGAGISGKLA